MCYHNIIVRVHKQQYNVIIVTNCRRVAIRYLFSIHGDKQNMCVTVCSCQTMTNIAVTDGGKHLNVNSG